MHFGRVGLSRARVSGGNTMPKLDHRYCAPSLRGTEDSKLTPENRSNAAAENRIAAWPFISGDSRPMSRDRNGERAEIESHAVKIAPSTPWRPPEHEERIAPIH